MKFLSFSIFVLSLLNSQACSETIGVGIGGKSRILVKNAVVHGALAAPALSTSTKVVNSIIYSFFILVGLYVGLVGFKYFRMLMVVLGFYTCYFITVCVLEVYGINAEERLGIHLGVFFGSLFVGFLVSIVSYFMNRANFIIFGLAVSSTVCFFVGQFWVNFNNNQHKTIFFSCFVGLMVLIWIFAWFFMDHSVIIGSSIVSGLTVPLNVGFLLNHFSPFMHHSNIIKEKHIFIIYSCVSAALFILGLTFQYYLRHRIVKRIQDESVDVIRGTSFLN